ncbi:(d)CMP kinase, partial [Streptomyces caeruleatus]
GPGDVIDSLDSFDVMIGTDPDKYFLRVGSDDVTEEIREPRISSTVSRIARIPEVRAHLTNMFREIIATTRKPGIIVEG